MAGRSSLVIAFVLAAFTLNASASGQERLFSLSVKGSLTTGSQLFPRANSSNSVDRASFFPLEDILGFGAEVRYHFPQTNLAVGMSVDYIRATADQRITRGSTAIPVEDGYRVIPLEITGYFYIPVAGPTFGVFMGGGAGVYFGRRIYRIAGVDSVPIDQGHGYGIHVLGGVVYRLTEYLALDAEMKFRDVQFEATNAFAVSDIPYGGTIVSVTREPQYARIHTDGVVFQFGVSYSL
ncbi:MAG: hypothetical protein ACKVRP_00805 [Bacteroidota bacterium]